MLTVAAHRIAVGSLGDVAAVITAIAAMSAVVAGYIQFVLTRSLRPCIEFDVNFSTLQRSGNQSVGQIVCSIKNVGPGVGFVKNVRSRVKYRLSSESGLRLDGVEPSFMHGDSTFHEFAPNLRGFIQPGVTQWYRKPLALPAETNLIHVWAAFEYHIQVGRITRHLPSPWGEGGMGRRRVKAVEPRMDREFLKSHGHFMAEHYSR
jgi:hypothetical protein